MTSNNYSVPSYIVGDLRRAANDALLGSEHPPDAVVERRVHPSALEIVDGSLERWELQRGRCQLGPNDERWPVHSCGSKARKR